MSESLKKEVVENISIETIDVINEPDRAKKVAEDFIKEEEERLYEKPDLESTNYNEHLKRLTFIANHTTYGLRMVELSLDLEKENPGKVKAKVFLIKEIDKTIGLGVTIIDENNNGKYKVRNYISRLYDEKGKGVGYKLMEKEIEYIRENGITTYTSQAGAPTLKIFDRLIEEGKIKSYKPQEYQNEFLVTL